VLHAARWKRRTQTIAKNLPSGHHRTTLSGYIFATKACIDHRKNLLNNNISPTCPHNMVNFGSLTAEIHSVVWGTPSKFQRVSCLGFVTAATSLTGGQRSFARCLAVSWAGTLFIHFRGLLPPPDRIRHVQCSLCVQVLRSPILAALLHGTPASGSAKLCGVIQGMELRNFRRRRHLYSAGRPSRWASAHILVLFCYTVTVLRCWVVCDYYP